MLPPSAAEWSVRAEQTGTGLQRPTVTALVTSADPAAVVLRAGAPGARRLLALSLWTPSITASHREGRQRVSPPTHTHRVGDQALCPGSFSAPRAAPAPAERPRARPAPQRGLRLSGGSRSALRPFACQLRSPAAWRVLPAPPCMRESPPPRLAPSGVCCPRESGGTEPPAPA